MYFIVKTIFFTRLNICRLVAIRSLQTGVNVLNKQAEAKVEQRERLVILGTGWGSYSVLRHINKKLFDVIVISPRNHFLFTPLLCSTTVGTLEFRSIIEPIRNTGFRDEHHFQLAEAVKLLPDQHTVVCRSILNNDEYVLKYDRLVVGVGAVSNTFGIAGVHENAFFLKEIADARKIRNQILQNFELAMQPGVAEEEKKRLLHFVIVGGGPTGVEFGAELYDFVKQDVTRLYAHERSKVSVTLIEARQILPSFDAKLRDFAERKMRQRDQFQLVQSSVTEVHSDHIELEDGSVLPCGLVVWSTGLAPRPFTGKHHFQFFKSSQQSSLWLFVYLSWPNTNLEEVPLTDRFHVDVRLFGYRSQITSKCVRTKKCASHVTDVLTTF